MKISLAAAFALVLCQLAAAADKPTCESIGCTGPFKLCTQQNGKPHCLLLGPGPVQTCATIKCPQGQVCVNVNQCVNKDKVCGKTACKENERCINGKCEVIFVNPIRPTAEDRTRRRCGRLRCPRDHICVNGKCELIFTSVLRPTTQATV